MTNYLNKRLLMTMLLLYIVCCIGYHKKWGCHFIVFSYLIFFLSLIICKWFPRNLLLWYVITISKKARLLGIKRNKMYFVTYCYFFFVCCCLSLFFSYFLRYSICHKWVSLMQKDFFSFFMNVIIIVSTETISIWNGTKANQRKWNHLRSLHLITILKITWERLQCNLQLNCPSLLRRKLFVIVNQFPGWVSKIKNH